MPRPRAAVDTREVTQWTDVPGDPVADRHRLHQVPIARAQRHEVDSAEVMSGKCVCAFFISADREVAPSALSADDRRLVSY